MGCAAPHPFKPVRRRKMILEQQTFDEYDYWPHELAPQSHKLIISICICCGKVRVIENRFYYPRCKSCAMKGRQVSEINRQKLSERMKGEGNPNCGKKTWMYGKHHSAEARRKMRAANKGQKNPHFGKKHTEAARKKMRQARRHQKLPKHHTKPELIFEAICKKYDLPFHYVGDSSLWIGKNNKLNPDFIEANGKKICIEIFGDYWHSRLLNQKLPKQADRYYRQRHYKKFKWASVFFWETDLKRPDAEQFVLSELKKNKAL